MFAYGSRRRPARSFLFRRTIGASTPSNPATRLPYNTVDVLECTRPRGPHARWVSIRPEARGQAAVAGGLNMGTRLFVASLTSVQLELCSYLPPSYCALLLSPHLRALVHCHIVTLLYIVFNVYITMPVRLLSSTPSTLLTRPSPSKRKVSH